MLGYIEDGPNLVLVAMNGWADPEPAWYLNLQAHPEAVIDLPGGSRTVTARVATGEERSRLWSKLSFVGADIDGYAALRSRETALVILEPRPGE
jgi:deazaflavin-dependent oxidoreductase (nitroreductase family)